MESLQGPVISRRQFLAGGVAAGAILAVRPPRLALASTSHDQAHDESGPLVSLPSQSLSSQRSERDLRSEFADDFDDEPAGSLLTRWETLGGSTVLGRTRYGDERSAAGLDATEFLRHHGMVVALDGAAFGNQLPGRIRTVETFRFLEGVPYTLEFDVAGAHRAELGGPLPHTVVASVPGVGAAVRTSLPAQAAFRPVCLRFTPRTTQTSRVEFASADAAGRGGVLIDNVRLRLAA